MEIMWVGLDKKSIYPNLLSVKTSVQLDLELEVSNSESELIIFGDISLRGET